MMVRSRNSIAAEVKRENRKPSPVRLIFRVVPVSLLLLILTTGFALFLHALR